MRNDGTSPADNLDVWYGYLRLVILLYCIRFTCIDIIHVQGLAKLRNLELY